MVAIQPKPEAWVRIARAADLKDEGPFALSAEGRDLVILRRPGGWRGFQGLCPHQGALLGEGEVDGDSLVCRNHRWRFDAETGQRAGGPQCLARCPIEERGGELWADVAALPAQATRARGLRQLADLPGPRGLPIVGNALALDVDRLHLDLEAWAAEYGKAFRYRLGPRQVLALTDPELGAEILRDRPEGWRRVDLVELIFDELHLGGVFSAEGKAWRPLRKLSMEALAHKNLKAFYATIATVAERLRRRWQAAAERGDELDIDDDLQRFTVDITTLLVFGHDTDALGATDDPIRKHIGPIFPKVARRLNAVIRYWRLFRLPSDRRVDAAIGALEAWLGELITQTRARMAAEPERAAHPANFLEAMLAARDEAGQPFSDAVLFGNSMNMLLAGEDTTAHTLAWAVHELCERPAVVARMRDEIDRVLGDAAVPTGIDQAGRLDYVAAVANEAMRLRPVAPLMFLECNVDTVVGDVALARGSIATLLTRPPTLEPERFAAPAELTPERWLPGFAGAHDASAFMPFGSGPRICPGRSLALLEMRVVLATLYKHFEVVRIGDPAAVTEVFSFTVAPRGLRVKLAPRATRSA